MRDTPARNQPLRPHPHRVACAVALLLAGTAWAQTAAPAAPPAAAATAAAAATPLAFDIAAGPLDAALRSVAVQAGVALTFTPEQTAGLRSPGVRGSHSVEGGFAAVLAGTPLQAVRQANGGYALRALPAAGTAPRASSATTALAEVRVDARADRASTSDGSSSYAAARLGIGGMAQKPREVAQSVSVMTRQRIEDQQLSSLRDVAEQTPGVTVQQTSSVIDSFYARGFKITNLKVDGGAGLYHGYQFNAVPDAAQFEQVEVLRGADALFSGSGEPGGAINLVRKRPTREPQVEVMLSAGRWNTLRSDLDVAGPLTEDRRLRGRAVLSYRETDSFQRGGDSDAALLYGVLEWDATPDTLVTVGASHDRRHDPYVGNGLPRATNGEDLKLPRSIYLAGDWSHFNREVNTAFAKLEQQLGGGWSLALNAMHVGQRDDRAGVGWATAITPSTGRGGVGQPTSYRYTADQSAVDLTLKGRFDLLGRSHELLAGGNWQRVESTAFGRRSSTLYTLENIFTFDPAAYPDPGGHVPFFDYPNYGIVQSGVFGVARLQLADRLKLIAGARHSRHAYDYIYRDLNAQGLPTSTQVTHYKESGITTPYGGLTYDIDGRWTAYASLAETYKSQADRLKGPLPGSPLDAITGRNAELGIKGELLDGRLDVAAALYHIKRNGEAVRDSAYPTTPGELGSNCCWLDDGRIVSKGLDLEASGELRHGWLLSAGYTFNSNSNKAGNGRYSSITPRHLLKLYTSVRLPGDASAWRVGGGANVQSATYVAGTAAVLDANGQPTGRTTPFQFREPGRAVWDLFAEYRINRHWSAMFSVRNLFDKTYYQTVGTSGYGNWYGEPRNASVTLRGMF